MNCDNSICIYSKECVQGPLQAEWVKFRLSEDVNDSRFRQSAFDVQYIFSVEAKIKSISRHVKSRRLSSNWSPDLIIRPSLLVITRKGPE